MVATQQTTRPYKQRECFTERQKECQRLQAKFPAKIPMVIEPYRTTKSNTITKLDKIKYVFPVDLPMGLVNRFIRGRLASLSPNESLYLFVGETFLVSASTTVGEVYKEYRDDDGFVYVTYATQETFGA